MSETTSSCELKPFVILCPKTKPDRTVLKTALKQMESGNILNVKFERIGGLQQHFFCQMFGMLRLQVEEPRTRVLQ